MATLRNIFACAVHERRECIVDLLRNLRSLDPDSAILLYNGGGDPGLLDERTLARRYGAVVHPRPRRLAWGRLHDFALDCMRFALDAIPFDTLTFVDSDQLLLRAGYPDYLARFLDERRADAQRAVGMLGVATAPQTAATANALVRSALKEIDLWRPLLRRFAGGEQKFVYWTYWPASVFTADAARDLTRLYDADAQLQEIIGRTRIVPTEEIILPTLCALLGYDITASPCSYDYVRWRVTFAQPQIDAALSRPDVFWVHPVARHYANETRGYIRANFGYYNRSRTACEAR